METTLLTKTRFPTKTRLLTAALALLLGACGSTSKADRIVYATSDTPFPRAHRLFVPGHPRPVYETERRSVPPRIEHQESMTEAERLRWIEERSPPRYVPTQVTHVPVREIRYVERERRYSPAYIPLAISLGYSRHRHHGHWSYGVGYRYGLHPWWSCW